VSYDNVVLVGGFSKAYSSLLAFLALPTRLKDALKVLAPPYLYSGPSPVASLATTLAGLDVNADRGDRIRADLWRKTQRLLDGLAAAGIDTPNTSGLPIVEVPLHEHEEIDEVGRFLFDHGVYATMAAYPLVPKHEVGFRLQVTAANTDDEIEHAIGVLGALRDRFRLRQAAPATV
jgi:8-amino-7-oxononanoate synthase